MMIKVVACLIEKDNKVLIAKRSTGDPNVLGKWEFPGGKVEPNEDEKHAIESNMKNLTGGIHLYTGTKKMNVMTCFWLQELKEEVN